MKLRTRLILLLLATCVLFAGCKALDVVTQAGTTIGVATGTITPEQKEGIDKSMEALGKAIFDNLTPSNEYYVGRTVVANMLATYKPSPNRDLELYINRLGQTLAAHSDMPDTFKGYRFFVMDTDEINAFAAPGGFILVSRGLMRQCRTEDALASVLAHEIGHIELRHAIKAIKSGRWTTVAKVVGQESLKQLTPAQAKELVGPLSESVGDITGTLMTGYDRKLEYAADEAAVRIMSRMGYSPQGLKDMLLLLQKHSKPGDAGFGKTHPTAEDRLDRIEPMVKKAGPILQPAGRKARFEKFMRGV